MKIMPLHDAAWGGGGAAATAPAEVPVEDEALLDAYSRAVIDVVDRVGPALSGSRFMPAMPTAARAVAPARASW
jgi:hypothetical protein